MHFGDQININSVKTRPINKQRVDVYSMNFIYNDTFSGSMLLNALWLVLHKKSRFMCPVGIMVSQQKYSTLRLGIFKMDHSVIRNQ